MPGFHPVNANGKDVSQEAYETEAAAALSAGVAVAKLSASPAALLHFALP
jgi:hypothetical protein